MQFRSVHEALSFAYRVAEQVGAPSLMRYAEPTAKSTSPDGLTAEHRRAQAALILGAVDRLDKDPRNYIRASFSWDSGEANEAGGAILELAASRLGTTPSDVLLRELVIRHLARSRKMPARSMPALAAWCGISTRTAHRVDERLRGTLAPLWGQAESALLAAWDGGLIATH